MPAKRQRDHRKSRLAGSGAPDEDPGLPGRGQSRRFRQGTMRRPRQDGEGSPPRMRQQSRRRRPKTTKNERPHRSRPARKSALRGVGTLKAALPLPLFFRRPCYSVLRKKPKRLRWIMHMCVGLRGRHPRSPRKRWPRRVTWATGKKWFPPSLHKNPVCSGRQVRAKFCRNIVAGGWRSTTMLV